MKPPPLLFVLLAMAAQASAQHRADLAPDELIEKARNAALHYSAGLPDFICTQVVQRYEDPRATNNWTRKDTLTVKLTYFERLEDYKLIQVDGKATLLDYMSIGGPTTKGEFGTLLLLLFHPKSQAEFHWKGWSTIHKRRAAVYTYKIDKEHSSYFVAFGDLTAGPNSLYAPYHGEIYVEPETGEILHVTQMADLPPAFPITRSSTSIDYDYRDVGGHEYLLPVRAEVNLESVQTTQGMRSIKYRGRNLVEFKDFRKFQTETTINFDTVDGKPKPPDKE